MKKMVSRNWNAFPLGTGVVLCALMVVCSWPLIFAQEPGTTSPGVSSNSFPLYEQVQLSQNHTPKEESSTPHWSGVASPEDTDAILESWGVSSPRPSEGSLDHTPVPGDPESLSSSATAAPSSGPSDIEDSFLSKVPATTQSTSWLEPWEEQEIRVMPPTDVPLDDSPTIGEYLDGSVAELPAREAFRTRYTSLFRSDRSTTSIGTQSSYGEISLILNAPVERSLNYFKTGIADRFQIYLDRFETYKSVVQQIFIEFGLPVELSYLSLVESGFNPKALSRARASGPWQFMKATGRRYGLRVNWHLDERRDPVKSTVAAAHHLRDLYDEFGSWPLALAAYNAGSGKISRAIRKSGTRDYWKIRQSWRYIRRETRDYVPRFVAATIIATNPHDHGFTQTPADPYAYDEVLFNKRVHLQSITKATGIAMEDLKSLNPELRKNIIPSQSNGYYLKVPVGTRGLVETHYDKLNLWKQPIPRDTQWYRVRHGDSLSVVAKRFGMSVRRLKALNNRRSNLIRVGDRLRVSTGDQPIDRDATWYTVRYGDSLSEIAQKFGIRTRTLRNLNNLTGNRIYVGDRLRVKGTPRSSGESKWYRVRRGDSLWSIARRFSVSVTDLKLLNNLTSSVIRAGRLLLVSQ